MEKFEDFIANFDRIFFLNSYISTNVFVCEHAFFIIRSFWVGQVVRCHSNLYSEYCTCFMYVYIYIFESICKCV